MFSLGLVFNGCLHAGDAHDHKESTWEQLFKADPMFYISMYQALFSALEETPDQETKLFIQSILEDPGLLSNQEVNEKAWKIYRRVELYKALLCMSPKIRDKATKEQVKVWLGDQSCLDDVAVQRMVRVICHRIKLVELLEGVQGKITDQKTREKVSVWLSDTPRLDNPLVCQEAGQIVARVEVVSNLIEIYGKISDEKEKALVKLWLSDVTLLDDSHVRQQAEELIERVTSEQFSKLEKLVGNVRNGSLLAYVLYRKFMFVKAIDTGISPGVFSWLFNWAMSVGYPLSEALSNAYFKGVFPDERSLENWGRYASFMKGDDAADAIGSMVANEHKEFLKPTAKNKGKGLDEARKKLLKLTKIKTQIEIKGHGFRGQELDFFPAFDAKYDHSLVEKPVDSLLEKIKVPGGVRDVLWRNKFIRFARRMALFKVFPTYLYWQGKVWLGNEEKNFTNYIPYKEAIKSIGLSFRFKLSNFLMKNLNVGTDERGLGILDRMHDRTLGIIGPNLLSKATELGAKGAIIHTCNKLKPGFLNKYDYFDEDTSMQELIVKKSCNHVGKTVLASGIRKVLGWVRPLLFDRISKKTRTFLRFLARKDWIDPVFASDEVWEFASVAPYYLLAPLYFFFLSENSMVSTYDFRRASMEVAETGDQFVLLDYLLAGFIGEKIASWGTSGLMTKLKAGHVIE